MATSRYQITHRVAIMHTPDPLEAWDFCRGVASYRPRSGIWGLHSVPLEADQSQSYLAGLARLEYDGVIMMPGRRQTLAPLHKRGIKVVDVDGDGEEFAPYPRIRIDNIHIGRLAGKHLLDRGFIRVVYIGEPGKWSRERASGLQQVISEASGEFRCVVAKDWSQLLSESWILQQIKEVERPFAVMGCDDIVAARTVRAVSAAGWEVPTEVGVIGVDDRITECIGVQPPLSSIDIERFRAANEAARLLDQLFMGKGDSRQLHLMRPLRVTERESTSSYVYEDPDVAAAVSFIHRESCNGIAVDDVVRNVNLSRRTLERRFVQVLGRSPSDEIRRVRIDAVMRAIERTQLPFADIAEQCGFSCLSALSHSFRLATGMSPRAFRRKCRSGTDG
jgi:LacI family transcriptional regulator